MRFMVRRKCQLSTKYGWPEVGTLVDLPASKAGPHIVPVRAIRRGDVPSDWRDAVLMADNAMYDAGRSEMVIAGKFLGLYQSPSRYFSVEWQENQPEAVGKRLGRRMNPPPPGVQRLYATLKQKHEALSPRAVEIYGHRPIAQGPARVHELEMERLAREQAEKNELFRTDYRAWDAKYGPK